MKFFKLKFLCLSGLFICPISILISSCAKNDNQYSYTIDFNASQYTLDVNSQKTNFVLKATITDNEGFILSRHVQ
jgi:hypothetical protein